jgi:hypothetical protein
LNIEAIVTMMEDKYGQARRIWVLDRGMISEEKIFFLRSRQARYVVGRPKAQLKAFEQKRIEGMKQFAVSPIEDKDLPARLSLKVVSVGGRFLHQAARKRDVAHAVQRGWIG